MTSVYLLKKHPKHPYGAGHLDAAVIVGVYLTKDEPNRIAKEKNDRGLSYHLYTVAKKQVKP